MAKTISRSVEEAFGITAVVYRYYVNEVGEIGWHRVIPEFWSMRDEEVYVVEISPTHRDIYMIQPIEGSISTCRALPITTHLEALIFEQKFVEKCKEIKATLENNV